MIEERCAGRELMAFLGGLPDESQVAACVRTPDVVVLARNRHRMDRQVFLLCEQCLERFLATRQHLDGWVQNYRERHMHTIPTSGHVPAH